MAGEPTLMELVGALQEQLPTARIVGVSQNQAPQGDGPPLDIVELAFQVNGHAEVLFFRAPYEQLHGGDLVVWLGLFVENVLRIYALGEGGPATIVPPPGSDQPPGPTIGPGPVLT